MEEDFCVEAEGVEVGEESSPLHVCMYVWPCPLFLWVVNGSSAIWWLYEYYFYKSFKHNL